ncbi:divalent cation tolerance protein [Neorhodopirellula lusitana]|uniref:Divalent cation tolerance protein n=2 Tax=Neorhodopirellula lusitana TaxID=445327 RepID=A0ABY1QUS0_9BACT|nr:divalent cation tolerance protein [Neorhodopirellula lusitana]
MVEKKTDKTSLALVWTTVSSSATADLLAGELIGSGLAACVQIDGPIQSHYRWKDKIEVETEYRLLIKTRSELTDSVLDWLAQNHPYEQPELLVTPVTNSSAGYAQWVTAHTRDDTDN